MLGAIAVRDLIREHDLHETVQRRELWALRHHAVQLTRLTRQHASLPADRATNADGTTTAVRAGRGFRKAGQQVAQTISGNTLPREPRGEWARRPRQSSRLSRPGRPRL